MVSSSVVFAAKGSALRCLSDYVRSQLALQLQEHHRAASMMQQRSSISKARGGKVAEAEAEPAGGADGTMGNEEGGGSVKRPPHRSTLLGAPNIKALLQVCVRVSFQASCVLLLSVRVNGLWDAAFVGRPSPWGTAVGALPDMPWFELPCLSYLAL